MLFLHTYYAPRFFNTSNLLTTAFFVIIIGFPIH
jgi:hypothetical protein